MNLFEKLKEYILGITVTNGICIVAIKLKPTWIAQPSNLVGVEHNQKTDTISLYGFDTNITLDMVLSHLDEIVTNGINNELKNELFQVKLNELDKLFKTNSIEQLKNLRFTFERGYIDLTNIQKADPESGISIQNEVDVNYNTTTAVDEIESIVPTQEIIFKPDADSGIITPSFNEMSKYEDMTISEIAALRNGQ